MKLFGSQGLFYNDGERGLWIGPFGVAIKDKHTATGNLRKLIQFMYEPLWNEKVGL